MQQLGAVLTVFDKPFYVWGYDEKGNKVVKVLPTIADSVNKSAVGLLIYDTPVEKSTIEEVMADFEANGFVMPEQDTWDFPLRKIRVFMTDSDYLDILTEHPDLLSFFDVLKDFIVKRNGGRWIYLEELFDEHRFIFIQYGSAKIEEN